MEAELFDVLQARPKASIPVVLAQDPNDAERLRPLYVDMLTAKAVGVRKNATPEAKKRMKDTEKQYQKLLDEIPTFKFTLEALGAEVLDELQSDWPPTDEQLAEFAEQAEEGDVMGWNPEEFPPRFLAACCASVEFPGGQVGDRLTESQALKLWAGFSAADRGDILEGLLEVNQRSSKVTTLLKS